MNKIHFIAIGGAAMHNLAIALHKKGYTVTGSDDQIFEPSRSRLLKYGILPKKEGWDATKINNELDYIILGMHARDDNPELAKARELGLKIYSFPEFIYEKAKNKKRIVVGGSHGKTTITSMIMHVLKENAIKFDYLVGSQIEGFETMAGIDDDSEIAVFEGDEYLSSPLDPRPKFHLYHPDVAIISGIAWDHINVFPTFEKYVEQFRIFANMIEEGGVLIYYKNDPELQKIARELSGTRETISYSAHPNMKENGSLSLLAGDKKIPVQFFGEHNMENISAALLACREVGISDNNFYKAIRNFRGAANRLEKIYQDEKTIIYRDFAHSPSKLKATLEAVKHRFPDKKILACMELHTFSSLKQEFLPHYRDTMKPADIPVVFYNPETAAHKKIEIISADKIKENFNDERIIVIGEKDELNEMLTSNLKPGMVILLMSSGNFGGFDPYRFMASIPG